MKAEYSMEEVLAMAAEISDYGGTQAGLMLTAYAERIKEGEGAGPVAWRYRLVAPNGNCGRWFVTQDEPTCERSVSIERQPLFVHHPAQAAQVDGDQPLIQFRKPKNEQEVRLLLEFALDQATRLNVRLGRLYGTAPTAEPVAQPEGYTNANGQFFAAEPVAQGEAVSIARANGYAVCREELNPVIDDLRRQLEAQHRAVPAERSRVITERGRFEYALKALVPDLYEKIRSEAYNRAMVDDDDHNQFASWAADLAQPAERVVDGIRLIAAERQRQMDVEGWTLEHDVVEYEGGELASAAACYAMPPGYKLRECNPPLAWPWEESWWKPGDRLRELAKAGALIAAEIDRLSAAPSPGESNNKPTDCSGDPLSCPDNEGRGCYCSDIRRAGESA